MPLATAPLCPLLAVFSRVRRATVSTCAQVLKQGMLTKLSKGGFTANWNRRAFALIGSSLFYGHSRSSLTAQPKVFAEIAGCEVRA